MGLFANLYKDSLLNSIMKVGVNTRVAPGSVSPLLHLIPWVRTAICPPSPMTNLIYCRQIWGILSFVDCTLSYGFNISPLWPLWAARRGVGWQYDILSLSIIIDPLPPSVHPIPCRICWQPDTILHLPWTVDTWYLYPATTYIMYLLSSVILMIRLFGTLFHHILGTLLKIYLKII